MQTHEKPRLSIKHHDLQQLIPDSLTFVNVFQAFPGQTCGLSTKRTPSAQFWFVTWPQECVQEPIRSLPVAMDAGTVSLFQRVSEKLGWDRDGGLDEAEEKVSAYNQHVHLSQNDPSHQSPSLSPSWGRAWGRAGVQRWAARGRRIRLRRDTWPQMMKTSTSVRLRPTTHTSPLYTQFRRSGSLRV